MRLSWVAPLKKSHIPLLRFVCVPHNVFTIKVTFNNYPKGTQKLEQLWKQSNEHKYVKPSTGPCVGFNCEGGKWDTHIQHQSAWLCVLALHPFPASCWYTPLEAMTSRGSSTCVPGSQREDSDWNPSSCHWSGIVLIVVGIWGAN